MCPYEGRQEGGRLSEYREEREDTETMVVPHDKCGRSLLECTSWVCYVDSIRMYVLEQTQDKECTSRVCYVDSSRS